MAEIFNEQRVLGVVVTGGGSRIFNNLPVIGVRMAQSGVMFSDMQRTLGIAEVGGGATIWNDQPVRGVYFVPDARSMWNGCLVVPVISLTGGVDIFGATEWIRKGTWDGAVPTSSEWAAAACWIVDGLWDGAAPTIDATWGDPDGTPYTIWDGSEATT